MDRRYPVPEPKPLTAVEQQKRAALAHQAHLSVVLALTKGRAALWELAKALADFDDQSAWSALGYDTKAEWLADPEISMTRTTYYRLIQCWRGFHDTLGVPVSTLGQIDVSKAQIVLPAVEAGARPLEDALADAQTLGARDLRELYWGKKKAVPGEPEDAEEPVGAANGQGPGSALDDGSGPLRASDGAPIDDLLNADADPAKGAAYEKQLLDEEGVEGQQEFVWVPRTGVWALLELEALERVEPPPSTIEE